MSRMCSIEIVLHQPLRDPLGTINSLLQGGWRLTWKPDERMLYVPFGDDDYAWNDAPNEAWPHIHEELERKLAQGQRLGIVLHIEDTSSQVYFPAPYATIAFDVYNAGRKRLSPESAITDYSWYLRRIITHLVDDEAMIVQMTCQEWA